MPSSATKKTVSAPKRSKRPARSFTRLVAAIALVVLIVVALIAHYNQPPLVTLRVNGRAYHLEQAVTTAQMERGLGNRQDMAADHGMLFAMPAQARQCFWMKGMRFPLDIIWVDAKHRVTHVEPNLAPDTYPRQYCAVALDVIELGAGQAAQSHVQAGQTLTF